MENAKLQINATLDCDYLNLDKYFLTPVLCFDFNDDFYKLKEKYPNNIIYSVRQIFPEMYIEMKKYFKKISALLMAAIMVLTMCATLFAADKPVGVTIKGIKNEAGVTVTAYKIVNINDNGSYEPFLDGSITTNGGEEFTITSEQILALAKRTNELTENTPITTKVGDDYKADLGFGTWMILVTGSEDVLYNPAVVSVGKDAAGNKVYGTLDFSNSSWTDASGVIYMKKSEPTITKTAAPANTGDTAVVGTQCGDIIKYK